MRQRAPTAEQIREGWPWLVARYNGRDYVLKMRGGPRERMALGAWADEVRKRAHEQAVAVAEAAKADDVDAEAVLEQARAAQVTSAEAAEGTVGFLVAWAWSDPDVELVARTDYDEGKFAGPGDARVRCGLATVDELIADGWEWEAIEDVARAVYTNLPRGAVSRREVVEIHPFSRGPTEPSTTS